MNSKSFNRFSIVIHVLPHLGGKNPEEKTLSLCDEIKNAVSNAFNKRVGVTVAIGVMNNQALRIGKRDQLIVTSTLTENPDTYGFTCKAEVSREGVSTMEVHEKITAALKKAMSDVLRDKFKFELFTTYSDSFSVIEVQTKPQVVFKETQTTADIEAAQH